VTRLRAGRLKEQGSISCGGRNIFIFRSVQTGSGAHSSSFKMGTGGLFFRERISQAMALTTHVHLVPKVKKDWWYTSARRPAPIRYLFLLGIICIFKNTKTYKDTSEEEPFILSQCFLEAGIISCNQHGLQGFTPRDISETVVKVHNRSLKVGHGKIK
jgi:hypothetical protein